MLTPENDDMKADMDSAPADDVSSCQSIKLTPDIISKLGLDSFKPGDVIYAPVKIKIDADDAGSISGISIEAVGTPMDTPPDENSLVEIGSDDVSEPEVDSESNEEGDFENEKPADDEPNPDEASGESVDTTTGETTSPDDEAETKMLGYKRPKTPKSKMPKAKDFLMGEE